MEGASKYYKRAFALAPSNYDAGVQQVEIIHIALTRTVPGDLDGIRMRPAALITSARRPDASMRVQ